MKSPFPGMDPYLERHWGDVHQRLTTYICDGLQSSLPSDLRARMQERVYIELPGERHEYYPDVRLVEYPGRPSRGGAATALAEPAVAVGDDDDGLALSQPILIHLEIEPVTEGYIEIIDVKTGHRVVTAIEVLSPTNKRPGEGQRLYLEKRKDMVRARVNMVEIDLLRGGDRVSMVPPEQVPPSHRSSYQISVWRGSRPEVVAVHQAPLRSRLPVVAVPLRPTDRDVPLDFQALLDQCYRNGGYDDIDYAGDPAPPLQGDDAAWAHALLRDQGRR